MRLNLVLSKFPGVEILHGVQGSTWPRRCQENESCMLFSAYDVLGSQVTAEVEDERIIIDSM